MAYSKLQENIMYKFIISNSLSSQYYALFKYNSENIVWSEEYTAKSNAENCIKSVKENASCAPIVDLTIGGSANGYRWEIDKSMDGQYFTRFKAPNGQILVWSETYTQKHNAKNCAETVSKNALSAGIDDQTKNAA